MATIGTPRRRGRPPKVMSVPRAGPQVTRGRPRRSMSIVAAPPSSSDDDDDMKPSDTNVDLGDEFDQWKELKIGHKFETDEDLARFLLSSWETKETRRENSIQVGMATIRDFENFKSKTKKSSDEVIRSFLRLDMEPGQSAICVNEDVAKRFDSIKRAMNMDANSLIKHLLQVNERCTKNEHTGNGNFLAGIEGRVRGAVRDEVMDLIKDGTISLHGSEHVSKSSNIHGSGAIDSSPDSGKKRPRKSLPQRVLVEQDEQTDSDIDSSLSQSMSSASGGGLESSNMGTTEDTEVMQYNYVINSSPTASNVGPVAGPVTLIGNPQVSWTTSTPNSGSVLQNGSMLQNGPVLQTVLGTQGGQVIQLGFSTSQAGTSVFNPASEKELEARGIFKVGSYVVVKEPNGMLNCPQCDYKGTNIARLRKHFTLHTGKAYRCTMCDRSYTEEYKLKEHFQVKHEKSVHFKCQLCSRDFTSKGGLKYHTKTTHKKDFAYWCEACCKGFNYLQFYQAHMNKHNGPYLYKCNVCNKEFSYLATLSMHRKSCIGVGAVNSLTCEMCGETFQNDADLKEHISTEHCDVSRFRCVCGSEFRWRAGLENHKAQCSEFLRQNAKASATPKPDPDGLSNMVIVNVESLKTVNLVDDEMDKSTNVDFDDDSSDDVQIMNIETNEMATSEMNGDSPDSFSSRGKVHACSYCTYKTQKLSHMKRHVATHTGKKYKCHDCAKSFNELTKLRTHQNSKHQGQARYKCDKCTRTFSSKGGIMYHQQTKHNNSYKYKCETCDRGFNTIQHYMGHKNTHTGVRPFVCEKCNIGFSYPSVLTSHKRVCKGKIDGLTDGGLDLYPCKECKEKFAMPDALQQHIKEVHGTMLSSRYMCDCGESFELHALYELHKSRCSKCDRSTEMILQTVSVEADSTENNGGEEETYMQMTTDNFGNPVVCNQPVFPS